MVALDDGRLAVADNDNDRVVVVRRQRGGSDWDIVLMYCKKDNVIVLIKYCKNYILVENRRT